MKHIPNILSALRIVMVGVFVGLFVTGQFTAALSVYVLAFFTDVLDGRLARRNGWITNVGRLLDPLADKLMVVAALFCIAYGKQRTVYYVLFGLALVKEALMVFGSLVLLKKRVVVYADWFGKIATGLFAVGVVLSLVSFLAAEAEPLNLYVLMAATVLSYVALGHYSVDYFIDRRKLREKPAERDT